MKKSLIAIALVMVLALSILGTASAGLLCKKTVCTPAPKKAAAAVATVVTAAVGTAVAITATVKACEWADHIVANTILFGTIGLLSNLCCCKCPCEKDEPDVELEEELPPDVE